MKKWISLFAFTLFMAVSFAQVQRKGSKTPADSSIATAKSKTVKKGGRKEQMKGLGLSREQKIKLKEIRQSGNAKKDAVEADDKLSAGDKKIKMKELQQEQVMNTMSILSADQKEKLKAMRRQNKESKLTEPAE